MLSFAFVCSSFLLGLGHPQELIDVEVVFIVKVVIHVDEYFLLRVFIALFAVPEHVVYVLEGYVSQAHQLGLLVIEVYVLHADGVRLRLSILLRVQYL